MRYYMVAGEASGDLHGANLMKALKVEDHAAEFRYYGGEKMQAEGGHLAKHYAEMAFMGFAEVLINLRTILKNLKNCKADIEAYRPDVVVLIDFPGFNLKIAAFAKSLGIPVCYYISPKVWAWNQKRVLKIKRIVDKLFCILPFEVDFYREWGMEVDYVGNPLLDEIAQFKPDSGFCEKHGIKKDIVALLPGSRRQEIERLLPDMLSITESFPEQQFVVAAAPNFDEAYYRQFIKSANVTLVFGETYQLLHVAKAAVVASGTATLETALFHVPQVVVYRGGAVSVAIGRIVIKIKFISLVNLIMDKLVVTELIQEDCNTNNITADLKGLLEGERRDVMLQDYSDLSKKMGVAGASSRTAKLIVDFLKKTILLA